MFIRAGINGAVTWVPRMTRARKQVCGAQPSLSGARIAAAPAPRAVPPTSARVAAAPPPAAVAAPRAAPAPAPVRLRARSTPVATVSAPPPPPVAASPDPLPRAAVVALATPGPAQPRAVSCAGASPLSQQYLAAGGGIGVRCGPQSAPHVTQKATVGHNATVYDPGGYAGGLRYYGPGGAASPYLSVPYASAPMRVAPRHVYASQKASTAGIEVPPGYAPVWDDDRLNPYRAHQTLSGKAQMDAIWTRTTPRRLIPADPGPVVARGDARHYRISTPPPAPSGAATVSTKGAAPVPTAASAPAAPPAAAQPASHRYVQLGAFTDAEHARRTAQRIANSGMPARLGDVTRNGRSYTLVLAGPFETQSGLERGLSRVRSMGFGQAVLRR